MSRPIALVTGASSGIGADLAREAARDGHNLILVARRPEPLQKLADELKTASETRIITADLSKPGAALDLFNKLDGPIDSLINNAGLGANGPFDASDPARVSEMLQVNMVALTELTRFILPAMVDRGSGHVMLVASTAAFQPGPQMAVYYATKAYVLSFGEALAYELRDSGVTVTTLCPGPTQTNFMTVADMTTVSLAKSPIMMSSPDVARIGYQGMKKGKRVVIPGLANKISALSGRISPHAIVLPIANRLNSPQ
jgi:short-subunit dehydrogenase